jgi:hydroxypyruvate reductase
LIVSDTNAGEEAAVASGPTFDPPTNAPDPAAVIARYKLEASLPPSILSAVKQSAQGETHSHGNARREHYVLLDNVSAIEAASEAARSRGFAVEVARDTIEQPIAEGCALLLSRLFDLRSRVSDEGRVACLISGGEFACPVRGPGFGGRNAESALRWAIQLDALAKQPKTFHTVTLSAGTDGIDGNSPAAGAIADESSVERARLMKMDAQRFLDESDAYTFFHALGDAIITGPTGTNVRDLRIMLAE